MGMADTLVELIMGWADRYAVAYAEAEYADANDFLPTRAMERAREELREAIESLAERYTALGGEVP